MFLKLRYTQLISDQCVYIRKQDQFLSIVAVHIDDMTIFASNDDVMSEIKEEFKENFTITDLGVSKRYLKDLAWRTQNHAKCQWT